MTYSKAIELLGYTTPKTLAQNAALATTFLQCCAKNTPPRYLIAADVIIRASK